MEGRESHIQSVVIVLYLIAFLYLDDQPELYAIQHMPLHN